MTFTKQADFTKKVTDLTDVPSQNMTPSQIKSYFQTPADELKTTVNKLVDDLNGSGWVDTPRLGSKAVTREKVATGAIGVNEIDPAIMSQPTTVVGVQATLADHTAQLADTLNDLQSRGINVMHPPVPLVGAKGDGVTDDYTVIQNLHDFCFTNNIQRMFFPQPSNFYKTTKPLVLKTKSNGVGWWDGKAIKFIGADKATTKIVKITNEVLANVNSEVNGIDATILLYDETNGVSGTGVEIRNLYIENQSSAVGALAITGKASQRMTLDNLNVKSYSGLLFDGMFSSTLSNLVLYCTENALKITGNCTSNTYKTIYAPGCKNPYVIQSDYSTMDNVYADAATGTVFTLSGLGLYASNLGTESPKAQYIISSSGLLGKVNIQSLFCFRQTGDVANGLAIANCAVFYGKSNFIVNDLSILDNDVITGNSYLYDCGDIYATNSFEIGRITYYQNVGGNPPLLFYKTTPDNGAVGKINGKGTNINYRKGGIMPYLGSVGVSGYLLTAYRDKAIYLDNETVTSTSTLDTSWQQKYKIGDVLLINNPALQNKLGYTVTNNTGGDNLYVKDCTFAEIPIIIRGTTAQRPIQNLFIGLQYFDTTLNKPIWVGNSGWVDATGTAV